MGHVGGGVLDRLANVAVAPLEQLLARHEERPALTERGARDRCHARRPRHDPAAHAAGSSHPNDPPPRSEPVPADPAEA